jgi:hypothetical protein
MRTATIHAGPRASGMVRGAWPVPVRWDPVVGVGFHIDGLRYRDGNGDFPLGEWLPIPVPVPANAHGGAFSPAGTKFVPYPSPNRGIPRGKSGIGSPLPFLAAQSDKLVGQARGGGLGPCKVFPFSSFFFYPFMFSFLILNFKFNTSI